MARPVTLFTGQWADLPVEEMARKTKEFGYDGIELACWGDHFEVDKALADDNYCTQKREQLERYNLQCHAISAHLVGQAVCDNIDERHKQIVPDYVWGDGDPAGVNERAIEEMKNTARAAQKLGAKVVNGFTGSSIWHLLYDFPPVPGQMVDSGFEQFAERWNPILDVFGECGVKFALEVHPTEIAFDIYTARRALEAIEHRVEFGFNFNPSYLQGKGVDPVEFIRTFPDRIYHVHVKDPIDTLNGRSSTTARHLKFGDHRRGWDFRSPVRAAVNFEEIILALDDVGYTGPLSVELEDCGMDREVGAVEASSFVKKMDSTPKSGESDAANLAPTLDESELLRTCVPSVRTMFNQHASQDAPACPRQAFLCYSHADRRWIDKFVTHMKPWLRNRNLSLRLWDDSQIETGNRWEGEIESALNQSTDAVIFVSPDLLASDFVMNRELPFLLKAAEGGRLRITWLCVKACAYKSTVIDQFQAAHDPGTPLNRLGNRFDEVLLSVCENLAIATDVRWTDIPKQAIAS